MLNLYITGFIVVFKKSASSEQIEEAKTGIANSGKMVSHSYGSRLQQSLIQFSTGGKVTHEYGTVLNGFAAEIEPSYFQQLTALTGEDGVIDYIGRPFPHFPSTTAG